MAYRIDDSEEARWIDRIRAITFREAKEAGASFISRSWVAKKINRSEDFVKRNWKKDPYSCFMQQENPGRPSSLSQESKNIVTSIAGRARKSVRGLVKDIEGQRGKTKSKSSVHRELIKQDLKAFHVIKKPLITERNREDRLTFCDFLRLWDVDDFIHLAPCDEFFIWAIRGPNPQNDRIWARSVEDITDDEHYRQVVKHSDCIGLFLLFSARRLTWVIKERGESWDGEYFRSVILQENVIPFLKDPGCVVSVQDVTLLHDKAPCFKSLATQTLLRDNNIDFFDNSQWPGNSPDLNAAETVGAIVKQRVEEKMLLETGPERYARQTLHKNLTETLNEMREETDLFVKLLHSYPLRLQAIRLANGGHTKF